MFILNFPLLYYNTHQCTTNTFDTHPAAFSNFRLDLARTESDRTGFLSKIRLMSVAGATTFGTMRQTTKVAQPTNEATHRKLVNLNSRKYCAVFPTIKLTNLVGATPAGSRHPVRPR